MAKELKLGIVGISEGNGHPYSWAAIFNGYDNEAMAKCPFPVIAKYLGKQSFPQDSIKDASVTHIWTQKESISEKISMASLIPNICSNPEDMIGEVDGVLLARDDAENHFRMCLPFIKAGVPIFVDKPFSLSVNEAMRMFELRKYKSQIFTCSSLRFSKDLILTDMEKKKMGKIICTEASVMKYWDTYAIHVLEPVVSQIPFRGKLKNVHLIKNREISQGLIEWDNFSMYIKLTGKMKCPIEIKFYGNEGGIDKRFSDSFQAFKSSLNAFIDQIATGELLISEQETMELVTILEWGRK